MPTRPKLLVMSTSMARLVAPPEEEFAVTIPPGETEAEKDAWLAEHGAGFTAMICAGDERIDAARLKLLPNLRLIAVVAAGMDGLDLEAAQAAEVAVTNAGGLNAGDVADYAVTMLLAHRRGVIANDAWVRDGRWAEQSRPWRRSIATERVGIVGFGHIGRAIADRLAPFGCEIAWWGPRPKPDVAWRRIDPLAALAEWATTLIVAVRADDSTRGLIDANILAALGEDGLIVNIARGFVIDEPALIAALKEARLGGAALDVFAREPTDAAPWRDVPHALLSPHVAGGTPEAIAALTAAALANVRRHFAGEPLEQRVV